jgi:hypothetical protein
VITERHSTPVLQGIGLACAEVLGAAGAKVVIADVDEKALRAAEKHLVQQGISAFTCTCDVGDKAQVQRMIETAVERFGGLDVMVCNAAVLKTADFLELEEEQWDAVMRVNLKGVFLVSRGRAGCNLTTGPRLAADRATLAVAMASSDGACDGGMSGWIAKCCSPVVCHFVQSCCTAWHRQHRRPPGRWWLKTRPPRDGAGLSSAFLASTPRYVQRYTEVCFRSTEIGCGVDVKWE